MMRQHDRMPVLTLPDGRLALADTGCSGADIVANSTRYVEINGIEHSPVVAPVDLAGIARRIGLPRLDMLVGANLLFGGFTADLRHGTFEFGVHEPLPDEELAVSLPYTRPASGMLDSPVVEIEVSGQRVTGVFDTGAPYTLWGRREPGSDCLTAASRTDFHVGPDGRLLDFEVHARPESVRLGEVAIELDVAWWPDSWPSTRYHPDCVVGMDVLAALGASRLVLDPVAQAIRFCRPRRQGAGARSGC